MNSLLRCNNHTKSAFADWLAAAQAAGIVRVDDQEVTGGFPTMIHRWSAGAAHASG